MLFLWVGFIQLTKENPITAIENYRLEVVGKLPKLDRIDKELVTQEERDEVFEKQKEEKGDE